MVLARVAWERPAGPDPLRCAVTGALLWYEKHELVPSATGTAVGSLPWGSFPWGSLPWSSVQARQPQRASADSFTRELGAQISLQTWLFVQSPPLPC